MLDADASFRPETDAPAPLRPDPAPVPKALSMPLDPLPTETLPDAATVPLAADPPPATDEPADAPTDTLTDALADAAPLPAADIVDDIAADPRPVTPRRLLRFSAARAAEDAPIHALPVLNLFDGVFEEQDDLTDPRLLRSRARARRLLAAHEAALTDAERNLWHDDPAPEPAPQPAEPAQTEPQGRRIRHLTAADIAPHAPEPVHDPLRDRLHAARDALYTVHPDDPQPLPEQSLAARLGLQAMTALLLVLAWPIGVAMAAVTVLRSGDLRLTARTVAIAGMASALLQVVSPLLT